MPDKGKISAQQMALIMYPTVLATGFLALPTITAQFAKNDLWLTGILASLSGIIIVYATTRLHKLYPEQTVIEYSENIAGKLLGKAIGLVYFLYFVHATGIIVRQYAEFVTGNFLFETPILLIIASIMLLSAFAVRGGTELLARSAVIFAPVFIVPMGILLFLIPDLDVSQIFPVLSRGIVPVLKATVTPQAWVCEFFLMTFFLPCLTDPEKGRKWGMISLCAVICSLTYVNLITLLLLGPDTGNKLYPILNAFRYISFAEFFENLEALLLAMWVVGNFVKISVFYYAAVHSIAQCLKLSDYRPFVFPIGLLAVLFGLWDMPSFSKLGLYLRIAAPFEITLFLAVIPLLLLIAAVLRKRLRGP